MKKIAFCFIIAPLFFTFTNACNSNSSNKRDTVYVIQSTPTDPQTSKYEELRHQEEVFEKNAKHNDKNVITPPNITSGELMPIFIDTYDPIIDKGKNASVICVFSTKILNVDTIQFFTTSIMDYLTINDDIKSKLYDDVEKRIKKYYGNINYKVIDKAVVAFKNYASASAYLHGFKTSIEIDLIKSELY